ncbi:hypothetical protein OS493_027588 [Desmophyllum pertusum]|uniref:Uncharacterized protein n=1 Tax=Desmophyllum pertusum TaxID=174260 RepID=A0A9W9ZY87_9CNID|nr:hypothetical protein OS493_027588 [Desmophyllum pertusum]
MASVMLTDATTVAEKKNPSWKKKIVFFYRGMCKEEYIPYLQELCLKPPMGKKCFDVLATPLTAVNSSSQSYVPPDQWSRKKAFLDRWSRALGTRLAWYNIVTYVQDPIIFEVPVSFPSRLSRLCAYE